ncbi:MAG: NAD-dependent deacetylase [Cyanobacteriota bacterium erpe_2018_sw_21hr_WHONDRS-SW48-000092_B_bin.40]|nr:NAD-dependent deacetylase [Cyanobacteriota bacterium erpe_2018_sw_21hr_WHONDRS-SW48-000092_B_bin.40]
MMNCFTKLYKNVVVLTGAGVSTASGLPTYRGAGGLWADPDTARFSSPEGCEQDPDAAWRFWSKLREKSLQAEPNATHSALSDWAFWHSMWEDRSLTLITQNVDGLHQSLARRSQGLQGLGPSSRCSDVIELHGSIFRSRCTNNDCSLKPFDDKELFVSGAPRCPECKSVLLPDVVLFGEALPPQAEWLSKKALRECDLFIAIGTSGTVSPASGFVDAAKYSGAKTILVNLEPMEPPNKAFDIELLGTAESLVPRLEAEFFFNQKMCRNDLPPADEGQEEYAHVRFDMKRSPDEHAAREAHHEMLGSLDSVRYADPIFDAWVHRYYAIVRAHEYLHQCRLKYLTADELVEVEREVEDY